jgi:hypothetical protein
MIRHSLRQPLRFDTPVESPQMSKLTLMGQREPGHHGVAGELSEIWLIEA